MAGGQVAGRLEIEIVAEIAKLQADLRAVESAVGRTSQKVARDSKAANDNLRNIGQGAGQGIQQFSRDVAQLKAQLDPAWAAGKRYTDQINLLRQALAQGAITHKQFVSEVRQTAAAYQAAGKGVLEQTNAQRAGMQQLSFQLGDMATMYSMGAKPMQIFASQAGQVVQAVQMVTGGTSRLAAFLGGPWGMALTVATIALAPFIGKLWETFTSAKSATGALEELIQKRRQDTAERNKVVNAEKDLNGLIRQRAELEAYIARQPRNKATGEAMFSYRQQKDLKEVNARIAEGRAAITAEASAANTAAAPNTKLAESIASVGVASGRAGAASIGRVVAISAEAKAIAQQTQETERFIETLSDETAKIGLDEKALRQREVARQMAVAGTMAEKNVIAALNVMRERGLALQEAEKAASSNKDYAKKTAQMERELGLIGLTGVAREKMTLALAEQAEIEAVLIKLQKAEMDGNVALIAQLEEEIRLIRERYGIERKGVDRSKEYEDAADKAKLLNDQLRDMIGLLGGLGKVGSAIGGLLGIFTGNTSAVGGPIGDLLNAQIGTMEKDGKIVARTIGDEIARVFKTDGAFGKTMTSLLQGAGTGITAANAVFGKQSTTEQIGAALGGAAGKVLGSAIAGPIGAAVGSVIGGLAGSALGGLFGGGNTTARANITGANNIAIAGADSKNYGVAGDLAKSVVTGLQEIASALGGTIGSFNTTIGTRGDEFRVNTSGTSLKLDNGAVGFGEDAQAAIAFAISDAVKDGALQGLRAGTQALLQGGTDMQAQLQKALTFESVFKQLEAEINPLGFALDGIATKFDALRKIFDEAGASAAEYAQLAQLQALETAAAQETAAQQAIRDFQERADLQVRILQLQGKEQEALALARESELKGVKAALKPLQQMIYRLEDARAIMDQFKPLADSLREFRQELMGTRSTDTFGAVRGQYQATAASAANGDAAAMARLQQDATAYLDAARDNASSAIDYQRAVGEVLGSVDRAIFSADNQVAMAQAQINATMETNNSVNRVRDEVRAMREKSREQNERMEKIWKRFEGDGIPLRSDTTNPLAVVVV